MIHLATAYSSAPIGQAAAQCVLADLRPWKIHRNNHGSPRWFQRWLEAWWILIGEWSLHRAWQTGKDQGGVDEWRRIVINGGDLGPIIDAAIIATRAATPNGSLPGAEELLNIRQQAWERYRDDRTALGQLRAMTRK